MKETADELEKLNVLWDAYGRPDDPAWPKQLDPNRMLELSKAIATSTVEIMQLTEEGTRFNAVEAIDDANGSVAAVYGESKVKNTMRVLETAEEEHTDCITAAQLALQYAQSVSERIQGHMNDNLYIVRKVAPLFLRAIKVQMLGAFLSDEDEIYTKRRLLKCIDLLDDAFENLKLAIMCAASVFLSTDSD